MAIDDTADPGHPLNYRNLSWPGKHSPPYELARGDADEVDSGVRETIREEEGVAAGQAVPDQPGGC